MINTEYLSKSNTKKPGFVSNLIFLYQKHYLMRHLEFHNTHHGAVTNDATVREDEKGEVEESQVRNTLLKGMQRKNLKRRMELTTKAQREGKGKGSRCSC